MKVQAMLLLPESLMTQLVSKVGTAGGAGVGAAAGAGADRGKPKLPPDSGLSDTKVGTGAPGGTPSVSGSPLVAGASA